LKVLLKGGSNCTNNNGQNSSEIWDLTSGVTAVTSTTNASPRAFHAAVNLGSNQVLLIGGNDNTGAAQTGAEIFTFVATGNGRGGPSTFATAGNMGNARASHAATVVGTKVYITGGSGATKTIDIFSPVTSSGTFSSTSLPSAVVARTSHVALATPAGFLLLAGGTVDATTTASATTEFYDPGTNTFFAGPSMVVARQQFGGFFVASTAYMITGSGNATTATGYERVINP
jgi:hypothetical protein